MGMCRHVHRLADKSQQNTTTNTKGEHSDKVVTRMTFHALDDPEDGEPLVVALLNGSLPGLFGS